MKLSGRAIARRVSFHEGRSHARRCGPRFSTATCISIMWGGRARPTTAHSRWTGHAHVLFRSEWEYWKTRPRRGQTERTRHRHARRAGVELLDSESEVLPGIQRGTDAGSYARPLFLPRRVGQSARGRARRRDSLSAADHASRVSVRGHANPVPHAARERLLLELDAPDTVVVGAHFPGPRCSAGCL